MSTQFDGKKFYHLQDKPSKAELLRGVTIVGLDDPKLLHETIDRALGYPGRAYGEWCRKPEACKGKGYCPLDPTCGD